MSKDALELGARLIKWCGPSETWTPATCVLIDAVNQATLPATVEWLAEIARRYGFES